MIKLLIAALLVVAVPTIPAVAASAVPAPRIVGAYADDLGFNSAGGYILYSDGKVEGTYLAHFGGALA